MKLELFIDKLKNENGKLEGQRLNAKWFLKHSFVEESKYFEDNNLFNSKKLYMFINNETDKCECGSPRRFIGYRDGFKKYCLKCSKIKNNGMLNISKVDVPLDDVISFVKDVKGNYSTTYCKALSESSLKNIIERTDYLKDATLSKRLYHIEHNLHEEQICEVCKIRPKKFIFSNVGYLKFCDNSCAKIINNDTKINGLRKYFYKRYINRFKSDVDYDVDITNEDTYVNDKICKITFTHKKCNHTYELDINYQGHLKCPKCYPIRSKKQYDVYEFLTSLTDVKMNDRQFIKPLELDLLTETFALEYDSLMFHSYGKSNLSSLNSLIENKNYHLNKTNLCEDKGLQLFRVFSNEWNNKQDIWKSVLKSKLGLTEKIHGRKCTIKEVDSYSSDIFLNENHLQGAIKGSIRIGLFYDDELVSLMTFGKARRAKWKGEDCYELYRFCSKLNATIVGGGSRILKYFEKTFKPKFIISYANRRWSQGNLYDKLGFEFIENTTPNYFYFKGGDHSKLLSREQFQKHKLKDKLELFDISLTETENMFNNGYRKIYDCGSKIYIKRF